MTTIRQPREIDNTACGVVRYQLEYHRVKQPIPKPKRKDTRKGDRHAPGYWAKYLRERRAKKKQQSEDQK